MNEKLLKISDRAAGDLAAFIKESETEILAAFAASAAEAELNDRKPKFRLSFTISLDLDKDRMSTALTFGSRTKRSRDGSLSEVGSLGVQPEE